jgi:hypothetical protein
MTIDERLELIAQNLDTLTRIHIDNDREYRERFQHLTEAIEKNTRDIELLKRVSEQDGENIRALARIAEIHEQRLDDLDGQ